MSPRDTTRARRADFFMTPVTHALLPLMLGRRWLPDRVDGAPSRIASGCVAFSGVLPDALSPHVGLAARHAALSHSLAAWAIFTVLLALAAALSPWLRRRRAVLCLCSGAYLAHLFCDLISGGVPLLAPFDPAIRGEAWVPFPSWFVFDGVLLFYVYVVHRWLPLRRRLRLSRSTSAA